MAAVAGASCHLMFVLRSHPLSASPSSLFSLLKPLLVPSPNTVYTPLRHIHVPPPVRKTLFTSLFSTSSSLSVSQDGEETDIADDELETERGDFEDTQLDPSSSPLERKREERLKLEVPSLSVKERKELASYAHSLGEKLKTQLVGKSGVTSNLATSFIETLEANELLKIKIHRSCPGEFDDVVKQLEEATGSVAVGQIGRTLIIYRPSLSKLKAEEKKKQVRKFILKKQLKPRLVNKAKAVIRNKYPNYHGVVHHGKQETVDHKYIVIMSRFVLVLGSTGLRGMQYQRESSVKVKLILDQRTLAYVDIMCLSPNLENNKS
ncbi:yqeI [Mucuna pruriens]|uniref:YqeI n=1 Tax=Mucuna pruriens TaxID=157652 RepID=A0A371FA38_MUCPR|nr:yqeI [Mucuna pruriens]